MTVSELVRFLQQQPQNLQVAYNIYSEYCLLYTSDIEIVEHCKPRSDGWIQYKRRDKETQEYLMLPGN